MNRGNATDKSRQQNSINISFNAKQHMYERNRCEEARKQNKRKTHTHTHTHIDSAKKNDVRLEIVAGFGGGRVVACTLEKSEAGGGVDVKAAVVDLHPSSCTRERVRLRNPARTPNTVSCQVARPPLRSSHARHTPYSLRLSRPFPIGSSFDRVILSS